MMMGQPGMSQWKTSSAAAAARRWVQSIRRTTAAGNISSSMVVGNDFGSSEAQQRSHFAFANPFAAGGEGGRRPRRWPCQTMLANGATATTAASFAWTCWGILSSSSSSSNSSNNKEVLISMDRGRTTKDRLFLCECRVGWGHQEASTSGSPSPPLYHKVQSRVSKMVGVGGSSQPMLLFLTHQSKQRQKRRRRRLDRERTARLPMLRRRLS